MTDKQKKAAFATFLVFCFAVLSFVATMSIKGDADSRELLEESIKSQLISITAAAREIIDPASFVTYNGSADIEGNKDYGQTLQQLRKLARGSGAEYIYAVKKIGDKFYFVFDTDEIDSEPFTEYTLSLVHYQAFGGINAADVMNVKEEYGSFNTGAVPIIYDGQIVGIVCADITDTLLAKGIAAGRRNNAILITVLVVTFVVMSYLLLRMLGRVQKMQAKLTKMAHYDKLTDLPNRQFLLDQLAEMTEGGKAREPFALYFIDLDNFKQVNDNAGHDAGDALLQNVGKYLEDSHKSSRVYRPGSGSLTVAARIGGDEFIVVMPGFSTEEQAAAFAQELLDGFHSPEINKHIEKYKVGLSIGVAFYPHHTENLHVLIKYADIAMYNSKREGKNRFKIYNEDLVPKDEK